MQRWISVCPPRPRRCLTRCAALSIAFLMAMLASTASGQFFSIGTNFTGSNFNQSGFFPPDTMGAVGPNHITELINGRFAVYNRSGALQTSSSLDQFWVNAGVTPSGNFSFDPRIIYDSYTSRWLAAAVDNNGGANNYLVAVSNSANPMSGWTGYQIDSDADDSHWADFPQLGLNQGVVTVSANMFPLAGGMQDTSMIVIDKSSLIGGTPTITKIENIGLANTGFTPQPVFDQDNNALPQRILSAFNKPAGFLKTSLITGTPGSPSLNTTGGFISVTGRGAPPDIDQPGPKADIDAGDNRFSGNVVQQHIAGRTNASLWAAHGVEVSGLAAIEWYEIDSVTNTVLQSGLISDSSLGFNFPSIAVNDFGDVVIGFSGGDPNTFISTYFVAGQTVNGVTTFGAVTMSQAGVADYEMLDSQDRNRWGDYSATVVDPLNPRHFWTFQEWASATDVWSTQITQIIFVPEPSIGGLLFFAVCSLTLVARRKQRIASYSCRCTLKNQSPHKQLAV